MIQVKLTLISAVLDQSLNAFTFLKLFQTLEFVRILGESLPVVSGCEIKADALRELLQIRIEY